MKQCRNTETEYGCITKIFHWTIAILIMGMLGMGLFLDDIPQDIKPTVMLIHKSTGFTLLLLGLARLIWKLKNITPRLPDTLTTGQKKLATAMHHFLYLLMIIMPLNGVLFVLFFGNPIPFFGLFEIPSFVEANKDIGRFIKDFHAPIAWIFILTLVGHIGAGLYHHFILKDNTLKRMTR